MTPILLTTLREAAPSVTPTWPLLVVALAVLVTVAAGRLLVRAVAEVDG